MSPSDHFPARFRQHYRSRRPRPATSQQDTPRSAPGAGDVAARLASFHLSAALSPPQRPSTPSPPTDHPGRDLIRAGETEHSPADDRNRRTCRTFSPFPSPLPGCPRFFCGATERPLATFRDRFRHHGTEVHDPFVSASVSGKTALSSRGGTSGATGRVRPRQWPLRYWLNPAAQTNPRHWPPPSTKTSDLQNTLPDAQLFGRKTYDKMAAFWPTVGDDDPFAKHLNHVTKYVASRNMTEATREGTTSQRRRGRAGARDQGAGRRRHLGARQRRPRSDADGSRPDRRSLAIHPILLGSGKTLFRDGEQVRTLELVDSTPTTTGVTAHHLSSGPLTRSASARHRNLRWAAPALAEWAGIR